MRLKIELVPRSCWYSNLRKVLPKEEWDKIRKETYRKANYKCEICGAGNQRINCHEIWDYNDKKCIQKLKGFQALCNDCHWIKHFGLAQIKADEGELDIIDLENHFQEVNKVSYEKFEKHVDEAFSIWAKRSNKEWITDLGKWKNLI